MSGVGPLCALAFDHRHSLLSGFFGVHGEPTPADVARCVEAKEIVFDGLQRAVDTGLDGAQPALLVDERFGSQVIARARTRGIITIVPFEVSGQREVRFEHGDHGVRSALERLRPDYAKILIRYHPDADRDRNARQRDRLSIFEHHADELGIPWMLELLVPQPDGGPASIDPRRYDRVLRAEATRRAIAELGAAGLTPALWKLEGVGSTAEFERLASACRRYDRDARCLVLGRGEARAAVEEWFRLAAPVDGFTGFAVGRTVWWDALRTYFDGKADRDDVAGEVAANYAGLVRVFVSESGG